MKQWIARREKRKGKYESEKGKYNNVFRNVNYIKSKENKKPASVAFFTCIYYTLGNLKRNKISVKINQQGCNGESHAFGRLSLLRGITPIFAGLKHTGLSSPLY